LELLGQLSQKLGMSDPENDGVLNLSLPLGKKLNS
jgi:hypothetical protein